MSSHHRGRITITVKDPFRIWARTAGLCLASATAHAQLVPTADDREIMASAEGALGTTVVQNRETRPPPTPYMEWNDRVGQIAQIEYLYGGSTATQISKTPGDYMAGTLYSSSHAYGGPPGGVAGSSLSKYWMRFRVFQFPVQVRIVGYINATPGATAAAQFFTASPPIYFVTLDGRVNFNEVRTLVPGEYVFRMDCASVSDSIAGPPPCHSDGQFLLTTHTDDCMYLIGQPAPVAASPGGSAVFQFGAVGVPTVLYHWRRNGLPISNGTTPSGSVISGADSDRLEITNLSTADAGFYDCIAVNPCTNMTSATAELTICYSNCDGSTSAPSLNVLDFACFLNKFAAGEAYANCDGSTTPPALNVLDFACFLNAFATGCP